MTHDIGYIFMHSLVICISSFVEYLFKIFDYLRNQIIFLFIIEL